MKTGWKALMVVGAVVALVGSLVIAGPGGGPGWGRGAGPIHSPGMGMMAHGAGPMGPGAVFGPMARQLNLTDEQVKQIQTICLQSRADANEIVDAIDKAGADLHEAVLLGASEEQIRAAAATLGTAIGNRAVLQAATITVAKAVLTDEQRKEFEEIRDAVPHVRQRPRGQGFGGGPWGMQAHGWYGPGPGGPGPVHMPLEQIFKDADGNKDGTLTIEELRAFQDTMRGGWGLRHQQ